MELEKQYKIENIIEELKFKSEYYDKKSQLSHEEYKKRLQTSCTLYVGNLSKYTKEELMYEIFSMVGEIRLLKIGLNRKNKIPCGFCFIEYYKREDAETAYKCFNGTLIDDEKIRVDWDIGFYPARQYGRGYKGGQVRDEFKNNIDN